jgi:transposase-like protein
MSETKETIVKPVCPYCKAEMKPKYYTGYYESFSMWACLCKRIQRAKVLKGAWAN